MIDNWQKQLKQLTKTAKERISEQQLIDRKQTIKEVDLDFAKTIGEIQPIKKSHRYIPNKIKPKPCSLDIEKYEKPLIQHYVTKVGNIDDTFEEPPAQYYRGGQGKNDIKKLLNAQVYLVSTLDLHGYSQDEAQQVLNEFIEYVQQRGVAGKIIHGSGLNARGFVSTLKILVRRWLINHPEVLAYTEPDHHNDGAVLVLLRRKRDNQDESDIKYR